MLDDASREQALRLKRLQFESLARHASRLPLLIPLVAGLVGFIVWHAAPAALIVGWIIAVTLLPILRWLYSSRALARAELDLDQALRTMVVLSFCNGLLQGGGIALFFHGLSLEQKATVTMIMVCLSAGAVSANAGYSRSFYAWAAPMFAALCLAWALQGEVTETWIGLLLALFPLAEAVFVRDNERVLRESFEIRYQNERLISELEAQHRELELQREAVEQQRQVAEQQRQVAELQRQAADQQRLAAEEQRQAAARERDRAEEANRAKSRFLASASHDLRQPLHTLSLYSAALGRRKTDERTQEMAREIGNAIASLGALFNALLDISQLDAGAVHPEPARFALGALLGRIAADFRPLAAAKGLVLELDAPDPLYVETDPVLLERVLRNLVDNAVKYTAQGTVSVRLRQARGFAVLGVSDTGPGIPAKEHQRIFEEFYQLANPERDRTRGIGLGLAIVRGLTNLLGVELKFESAPGRGTSFVLSLPVAEPRPAGAGESPAAEDAALMALPAGARIIVVDDEVKVREGMRELLGSWGCTVTLAAGTAEALDALEEAEADLIIADQRLRGSETGTALVRRARDWQPGIAALLITGDTGAELLAEAAALELKLLHKPVPELTLRRAIAAVLRGGRR